jgi:phosphoribosyl-AMP cyclohydrolase
MTTSAHLWAPRTAASTKHEVEHGDRLAPLFDENGLIPAIVTDVHTQEILMFAWMNGEALERTLTSGYAHFWSRSRNRLWQKGEESGNRLAVRKVLTDCDQDVLQITVEIEGDGVACHTGARSCFYREVELDTNERPLRLLPSPRKD